MCWEYPEDKCVCIQKKFKVPNSYLRLEDKLIGIQNKLKEKYKAWRKKALKKRFKLRLKEMKSEFPVRDTRSADVLRYIFKTEDIPEELDLKIDELHYDTQYVEFE